MNVNKQKQKPRVPAGKKKGASASASGDASAEPKNSANVHEASNARETPEANQRQEAEHQGPKRLARMQGVEDVQLDYEGEANDESEASATNTATSHAHHRFTPSLEESCTDAAVRRLLQEARFVNPGGFVNSHQNSGRGRDAVQEWINKNA